MHDTWQNKGNLQKKQKLFINGPATVPRPTFQRCEGAFGGIPSAVQVAAAALRQRVAKATLRVARRGASRIQRAANCIQRTTYNTYR
eukprot:11228286-Lingulodinium_polyedra.AAC.2